MLNKAAIWQALNGTEPLCGAEIPRVSTSSAFLREQVDQLRQRAEQYMDAPIATLDYGAFQLYWSSGDREVFQALYFQRRQRLVCFSLLCWLIPEDTRYTRHLEEIIWSICAEPFWCLPAHFLDEQEQPLPFDQYASHLDLFACETGFALAETLALNGQRLGGMVQEQARRQVDQRIFQPFLDNGRLFRFEGMANNWSSVCGCAIGGTALILMEEGPMLTALLHRSLSCVDVYLHSFGADGVCVEGVGYWTYGFGFFTAFADLLLRRSRGAVDLFDDEKVHAIARSQQVFYLHGDCTVSFADGSQTGHFRAGLGCYLQRRYPNVLLPAMDHAMGILSDPCGRFCLSLRDFQWYDSDARFGLPLQGTAWLPDAQWFLSRQKDWILAAKAGHNGESHNHNDCGSFILLKHGVPLITDLGAGLYDAEYFSDKRYEGFVCSSRSHNIPIIAGQEQGFGREYAASEVEAVFGDDEDRFSSSLAGCYPAGVLVAYRRELRNRHREGEVTLADYFRLAQPGVICEVFVSSEPIRLQQGQALFSCNGVDAVMRYDHERFSAQVHTEAYWDHQAVQRTAYLLHLRNHVPAAELTCAVSIR